MHMRDTLTRIFDYFQTHKWVLRTILIVLFGVLAYFGLQCKLEENIFKLLPKPEAREDMPSLAFSNLKLKDKVFVLAQPKMIDGERTEATPEEMSEALDLFMEKSVAYDSATHTILNTLSDIDPLLILDAADYLAQHGPAYIDFTEEEMDSLCSEEHIRQQIRLYMALLETEVGQNFYDVISYDPCGISLKNLPESFSAETLTDAGMAGTPASSRFQNNHFFTGHGEACIGFITPTFGTDDSKTAGKMTKQLERAKKDVEDLYPNVEIIYHGTVIMAGGNSLRIRRDLGLTVGVSLLLIIFMLCITFKRPTYSFLMLIPIVYGVLLALTSIYLVRGWMSLMALGLGAIVLGVALSYCLHVMVHYVYTGDVRRTIKEQVKPVLMGSVTTIGAFAGLLLTTSSLLQDFGAFALFTIIGTTAFSLIAMPHLFPKKNTANRHAFAFLERINSYHIDRNKPICIIVLIWVAVCICHSGKYEFDSNLRHINYVSPATQYAQNQWNDLMNEGLTQQYYASYAPTLEEALEQLPGIEAVVDSMRETGIVHNKIRSSALLPSLVKQDERNEHWLAYFSEEKQQEVWGNVVRAAQKEGIDADMFEPFREKMAMTEDSELLPDAGILPEEVLNNFVEELDGMVLVYFPVKTTPENSKVAKDRLTKVPGCMVLDPYYYSTNLVELIHADFNRIMLISSIFVFLLLLVTYKNIWLALIAFLPMTLSWYTVLGAMALFHQSFNLINIVVSSFIFGIGVDYSIFIMDGLMRDDETITYHKTAITLSGTVLITCMFSLLFAVHPAINSIGFASLVGMITTMLLSYTLQPNLYRLYIKLKKKK